VALSFLPDLDAGMLAFVDYGHPLGHRGALHSLPVAAALGALLGLAARGQRRPRPGRLALLAALVLASHGLLDAMTHGGGLGVALLWPFDATRYWAPWRPIPIAPIGAGMWSRRGAHVLLVEGLVFGPVILACLLPGPRVSRGTANEVGWPARKEEER
jgi:inner membrane protein